MIENINNIIRDWLLEAATLCREFSRDKLNVSEKSSGHFVTDLDFKIDLFLKARIQEMFPDHNIISEEGSQPYDERKPYTWLLDPIDGTSYLIKGLQEYSIVMMLLHNNKPLVVGVINPETNALWIVSAAQFEAFIPGVNFSDYKNKLLVSPNFPPKLSVHDLPIKRVGSIAYRICLAVSCHSIGALSLQNLSCWDVLPGVFIAHVCGYDVMNLKGDHVPIMLNNLAHKTNGLIVIHQHAKSRVDKIVLK